MINHHKSFRLTQMLKKRVIHRASVNFLGIFHHEEKTEDFFPKKSIYLCLLSSLLVPHILEIIPEIKATFSSKYGKYNISIYQKPSG